VVLSGAGVALTLKETGQVLALNSTSPPVHFEGDQPVDCELVSGATQDFNVMVQNHAASAKLQRLEGLFQTTLASDAFVGICANATAVRVQNSTLGKTARLELAPHCFAWQKFTAGSAVAIECADALYLEIALCP
jgi:hypothetical protein